MTAIPKHLAQGLDVRLGQRASSAEVQSSLWLVRTEQGATYIADALLLTAPVPQSLAILESGGAGIGLGARESLEAMRYDPCIALMVRPAVCRLPAPGGMQAAGDPITWIGDNQQKGISPQAAVTIHAGADFSLDHWNSEDREIAAPLLSASAAWLSGPIAEMQVHRWRYAKPSVLHPERCLAMSEPLPLVFAGDAFGEPRVEGAALSGAAAAKSLLGLLSAS
jgi:predicted NAD/FAD-dependent oxidoreductase